LFLTKSYFFPILFDDFLNHVQIIILNHNINCITTFEKDKQNWKQIWKRKRFRKLLLAARSGSA
jgi:hypothetical protein